MRSSWERSSEAASRRLLLFLGTRSFRLRLLVPNGLSLPRPGEAQAALLRGLLLALAVREQPALRPREHEDGFRAALPEAHVVRCSEPAESDDLGGE